VRVYDAETAAAAECPVDALDGTVPAAQAYVDRITSSAWWRRNAPEHLRPAGRERVLLIRPGKQGSYAHVTHPRPWRGRYLYWISLGTRPYGKPTPDRAHIADPWVLLHELAHFLVPVSEGHGRVYAAAYVRLVGRWLGRPHAAALRRHLRARGLRPATGRAA
jgi:hypothetical protein